MQQPISEEPSQPENPYVLSLRGKQSENWEVFLDDDIEFRNNIHMQIDGVEQLQYLSTPKGQQEFTFTELRQETEAILAASEEVDRITIPIVLVEPLTQALESVPLFECVPAVTMEGQSLSRGR